MEKLVASYIARWMQNNASWYIWQFLKNVNIELPYDSALPPVHIYEKKLKMDIQTNNCI